MVPLSQYRIRKQEIMNAELDEDGKQNPVVRAWNPVQSVIVNAHPQK